MGRSTVEDMGIDHRCLDVAMAQAQESLDRSNIVTALEQVSGEGMPEGVTVQLLDYPCFKDGFPALPS